MKLKGKVIFIISYENWGSMLMSKHHYAIELGKAGNEVYFINHPDKKKELKRGEVKVIQTDAKNVSVVLHRLFHPYFLKFKVNKAYNFFISLHIQKIIRSVGKYPDVVWSFDSGNTIPLKYFPKSKLRILMPVDGPFGHEDEIRSSEMADIIISVTDRILKVFDKIPKPKFQINHGVAEVFLNGEDKVVKDDRIRIGYSGSLLRNDLDINSFLKIIMSHPDKIFEFWGEVDYGKSNIHLAQDISSDTLDFLSKLKSFSNVVLHGPVGSEELAAGIKRMDALLICYKIKNDQNHHKVLEYLGTGKVIISNWMSSYENYPELVEMVKADNNNEIPELFDKIINNLSYYNSSDFSSKRRKFAREFSYLNNIRQIEEFIQKSI
jgi:hypothetical protein